MESVGSPRVVNLVHHPCTSLDIMAAVALPPVRPPPATKVVEDEDDEMDSIFAQVDEAR